MLTNAHLDEKVKSIRKHLSDKNLRLARSEAEDLQTYKPVTLQAVNIRAEVMLAEQDYEQIIEDYNNYYQRKKEPLIQLSFVGETEAEAHNYIHKAYYALDKNSIMARRYQIISQAMYSFVNEGAPQSGNNQRIQNVQTLFDMLLDGELGILPYLANELFVNCYDTESLLCWLTHMKVSGFDNITAYVKHMEASKIDCHILSYLMDHMYNSFLVFQQFVIYDYPIIIVSDPQSNGLLSDLLAFISSCSGKTVWIIGGPISYEIEDAQYYEQDLLNISLNNTVEIADQIQTIHPIQIINNKQVIYDGTTQLIQHLSNFSPDKYCLFLTCENKFDSLSQHPNLNKITRKTTQTICPDIFPSNMILGHVGNYLEFITQLYGRDVVERFYKPAEVGISIVIPCRNNSYALEHSIRTCLAQRVTNYEIVISDNSSIGNSEVFDLVQKFNDTRIKYYKSPYELPLTKSFEFAYLCAKGEFIFSLGSDDGVFFHGLGILEKILSMFPDEDIISWNRGFYIWPDFSKHQDGQFSIPQFVTKGNVNVSRINSEDYMQSLLHLDDNSLMYSLPLLYINSGFRRRYLHKMLEHTGRLWDGDSQDIQTGITNICINKNIFFIHTCITVAGMCNLSVGANTSNQTTNQNDKLYTFFGGYYGNGVVLKESNNINITHGLDTYALLSAIVRAARWGINKDWTLSKLDYVKYFSFIFNNTRITDPRYELHLKNLAAFAKVIDNKALSLWIHQTAIPSIQFSYQKNENAIEEKVYNEGFSEQGALTLDARKFGVTNIYDACVLFQNIYNL